MIVEIKPFSRYNEEQNLEKYHAACLVCSYAVLTEEDLTKESLDFMFSNFEKLEETF